MSFRLYESLMISTFILFPSHTHDSGYLYIEMLLRNFPSVSPNSIPFQEQSISFSPFQNTFMDQSDTRIHDKGFLCCCYILWKMQFDYVVLRTASHFLVFGEHSTWISMECPSKFSFIWFMNTLQCLFTLCSLNICSTRGVIFCLNFCYLSCCPYASSIPISWKLLRM